MVGKYNESADGCLAKTCVFLKPHAVMKLKIKILRYIQGLSGEGFNRSASLDVGCKRCCHLHDLCYMGNSISPERPWAVGPKHSVIPSTSQLSETPFDWVLVGAALFGDVAFALVLAHCLLKFCFPSNLFGGTIVYELCRGFISLDKFVFVAKYLTVFSPVYRCAPSIHCVGWHDPLQLMHVEHSIRSIASCQWH